MKGTRSLFIAATFSMVILTASHVHAAAPAQPTAVSPGGKVAGSTITFQWEPVSTATKYQLQVKTGSTVKYNGTFTEAQADCSEGTGTCSVEATIGNGAATLSWTVRAGNSGGFGEWSEAKNFTMTDEMRTPISKLPCNVNNPGSYYVTGNLTSTGNGINVNADNVTIDLNGYTITGPGSGINQGVYMNGRKNVEIRNGTIASFGKNGVNEDTIAGVGHRVIGIRAIGNGHQGIALDGEQNLVENCIAVGNSYSGINVGLYSIVRGCSVRENQVGIYASQSGCVISDNISSENTGAGIFTGTGNVITGNVARYNGSYGIYVISDNTLKNNTATFNGSYGVYISGTYNLLDGNAAYHNNQSGTGGVGMNSCATCQWGLNVK